MDDIHKKAIARRVAARCSTDLASAVSEYIRLSKCELSTAEAEVEMLFLLDGYLHPVDSKDKEKMIFHAVFPTSEINCSIGLIGGQPLTRDEVVNGVSEPLRNKIIEYMTDCDSTNRELRLVSSKLEQAERELASLSELINRARDEYAPVKKGESADKRARRVAAVLGLTSLKREKEYTDQELYTLYVDLVRKQMKSRRDAITSVANSFNLAENTVLQRLNTHIAKVKRKWQNEAPQAWPTYEKFLKGLVPFKGDWSL